MNGQEVDPRMIEKVEIYRAMARHFSAIGEAYKTLHKWAEEDAVKAQMTPRS